MNIPRKSTWVVLCVASAVELIVVMRPRFVAWGPTARLLVDLAFQTLLLFAVPLAVTKAFLRQPLREMGLTLAGARKWLRWWTPLLVAALPIGLLCTRVPAVHQTYPLLPQARTDLRWLAFSTLVFAGYGLSWEFFFRGFILFGIGERFGAWALLVQGIPCALMHWGKPALELAAALPAAVVLGVMALRARSIIPGLALHCVVALCVNLGCVVWPLNP